MKPQSQVLNTACHSLQLILWKAAVNTPAKKSFPHFRSPAGGQRVTQKWPQQREGGPQRTTDSSVPLFILRKCGKSQPLKLWCHGWQANIPHVQSLVLAVWVVPVSVPIINTLLSKESFLIPSDETVRACSSPELCHTELSPSKSSQCKEVTA